MRADNWTVGQNNHVYTDTNYYYTYWDEAKQSSIRINASNPSNPNSGLWAPGLSSLTYDVNGHITTLVDQTASGGAKTVQYRNDAYGQVLVREEKQNGVIGPRQLYYYFAGTRIGDVGNNGASPNLVDYAQQLASRGAHRQTGLYRNGRPVASADFDENYQPINSGYPGAAATTYTVRSGDTLYTIARALWGDSAMWYLIAEANGLTSASQLTAGQRLIIPNKVTNFHNNSGTFRVYDPGEAIGDTMPTLPNEPAPPPAKKKGCGVFGQILAFIITVVVSIFLPPVGAAFGPVLGPFVQGALVSVVSQGINTALGLQEKFSWKDVGLSALQFGIAPVGGPVQGRSIGTIAKNIVVGAAVNAAIQGIAIATGLQEEFSWGSVAAAGVSNGLGGAINPKTRGGKIAKSVAQGLARATARSVVDGTDFGDTLMAELPGVIGTTLGNFMADVIAGKPNSSRARGRIAAADGPAGVMSDIGTPAERAMAEGLRGADIVVTATREQIDAAQQRGLFGTIHKSLSGIDRFFSGLFGSGSNKKRSNTDNIVVTYRPASSSRAQAELANAQLGRRLFNSVGPSLNYLYRGTLGPNTIVGRSIIKPVNDVFYGGLGLIANSPLGDPGVIMSIESAGPPGALTGTALERFPFILAHSRMT